jgi:hypothetical protein
MKQALQLLYGQDKPYTATGSDSGAARGARSQLSQPVNNQERQRLLHSTFCKEYAVNSNYRSTEYLEVKPLGSMGLVSGFAAAAAERTVVLRRGLALPVSCYNSVLTFLTPYQQKPLKIALHRNFAKATLSSTLRPALFNTSVLSAIASAPISSSLGPAGGAVQPTEPRYFQADEENQPLLSSMAQQSQGAPRRASGDGGIGSSDSSFEAAGSLDRAVGDAHGSRVSSVDPPGNRDAEREATAASTMCSNFLSCLVVAGYRISPGAARGSLALQLVVLALLITAAVLVGRELYFLGSLKWVYLVSETVLALFAVLALTFYFYSRILANQSPR